MNKQAIIISGGTISEAFAMHVLEELHADYIIGVDSGLSFLYHNHIYPTHIVGDFDSVEPEVIAYYKSKVGIPIQEFNPVKDATDTEIALRFAIELGAEKIWILGGTGTRLDHVMSNIQILKIALDAGVEAYLLDECKRISVWEKEITLSKGQSFGTYFSLFPLGEAVPDVTIEGAKYPVSHQSVSPYESRFVSNEVEEQEVKIKFPKGVLVLMETRDR